MKKTEYNTIHQWMLRHHKKVGKCSECGKSCRTQWANVSGNYLKDISDWLELCPKCHYRYDAARHVDVGVYQAAKTHCPKGHEYTPENTYLNPNWQGKHGRVCRTCKRNGQIEKRKLHKSVDKLV